MESSVCVGKPCVCAGKAVNRNVFVIAFIFCIYTAGIRNLTKKADIIRNKCTKSVSAQLKF